MNKIRSLDEIARGEQRRKKIGGIVIITLLLLSTIGFALSIVGFGSNNSTPGDVQGFSFNGQYWVYTAGSQKYYFTNHVNEVNLSLVNINKTLTSFSNKQIYVDAINNIELQELYNGLGTHATKINEACYGKCTRDLPEKSCLSIEPLIVIRQNEIESVTEQDNCIFIEGNLKTIDAFLYKVLGISV